MKMTLQEIAKLVGGRLEGDSSIVISSVNNIEGADNASITFADEAHVEAAAVSKAGAVLLPNTVKTDFPLPAIYVEDTRAAFAVLLTTFFPPIRHEKGISEDAHIGKDVTIGEGVTILPFAYVDDHAVIGDGVTIYPHVYVGQYSEIGDYTVLYSSVTIREHCKVGKRVIIHSSAVIGADGFGFTTKDGIHTKVPQVGNVVLEDDVEIGAHAGIDRATIGSTIIGHGTKVDNLVHIGHNCHIGANNLIVAQVGISGSTNTGDNVTFGGQTGTVGHINIGGNSVFAARSGIIGNTPEGVFYAGFPARPHQEWLRMQAHLQKITDMSKKIKALEKKLAELNTK
ncbi:MAG: UDP-3-O-(3-hydroxymyristoyl)glucosamine N-acyltransferase [Anaerovibrio sp.]|uniref:UDP-3-O-(3-hydroxymyristoyl)glucosamine N-acyltransferase n=1 Tax=Anaerovibrio sp. TaxID=1872532 RepID=UPI0025D65B99|nr:UDP-3-O-(3-hydroxymyristoyl)glucosamine N-acyltransferase [Anaerovibrio sp.]MCR5176192.1 UDP-3-O-(3-hydroxymyristoyl)glucosamine N-acyltransferase [Anaerovibrio sp.]